MLDPDAAYFRKQAEKCRWLARRAPDDVSRTLNAMAEEYDANARELDANR